MINARCISLAIILAALAGCSPPPSTIETMGDRETITSAAWAAHKLGKAGRLKSEALKVKVTMVDRYGNETAIDALEFRWRPEELARINWKTISSYKVLNLAEPTIVSQEGLRSLGMWCTDADSVALTPQLCGTPYEQATRRFLS